MSTSAKNININGRVIVSPGAAPPGIYTVEGNSGEGSFTNFTVFRAGPTTGSGSVDWAITENPFDSGTGSGSYVNEGYNIMYPFDMLDDASSGWIAPADEAQVSLEDMIAVLQGSLDSILVNGEYYDANFGNRLLLFTFADPIEVTSLSFDVTSYGSGVGVKIFSDLTSAAITTFYDGSPPTGISLGNDRSIYTYTTGSPITIKGMLLTGYFGYTLGRPNNVYGIFDAFTTTTSGTTEFGTRQSLLSYDMTYANTQGNTVTTTVTLSNPVGGPLGTPSSSQITLTPPQ